MNFNNNEFTLLSDEQTFGSRKIDVIDKIGEKCAISDFAIILGADVDDRYRVDDDSSLKGRTGWWYLSSSSVAYGHVLLVNKYGDRLFTNASNCFGSIRPVFPLSNILDISTNGVRGRNGFLEIEYGEYPQYVVNPCLERILESEFLARRIKKTGKTYTTDSRKGNRYSVPFRSQEHEEFEYNGKRYIRTKYINTSSHRLSNGETYNEGDIVWLEVSPLKWLVDEKEKILISKTCIASGIRFCNDGSYRGDFKITEMNYYLNTYFAKDMIPSVVKKMIPKVQQKSLEKRRNPYILKVR